MSHSFSNLFHMSSSMSTSTIWFLKAGQQRKFHTQDADGQHDDTDLFNKTEVLEEIWDFLSNTIRILLDYLPVTSTEL